MTQKNMKTYKQCLTLILGTIISFQNVYASMFGFCYQEFISKTVIKTRTLNQYNMPFVDSCFSNALLPKNQQKININLIASGTKSIDRTFGCEFAINRKPIMLVAGDNTPYKKSRDINAEFIGGTNNTIAQMSLGAEESLIGGRLFIQIPFFRLWKNDFFVDWFLGIRTTLTRCTRKLDLTLAGENNESLASIKNFFSNQVQYAKINNEKKTDVGLENVTLTLDGIYYSKNKDFQIYYFSGVEIPVQSNYSSEYLFAPTIGGGNGTIGLILGADFRGFFATNDSYRLGMLFELEDHYFLYKTMARTFDLYDRTTANDFSSSNHQNKPWSRYLPASSLYLGLQDQTIGSFSNLPVRVHPSNVLDVSAGFIYEQKLRDRESCFLSVGYNLWASKAEYSELQDRAYKAPYQDFYTAGIAGTAPNTSASRSTIDQRAANDDTFKTLTFNDLDMSSVAADGGYSQSAFFRASIIREESFQILFGGWYEFGKSLMIPSRIGGWIGGSLEF